MAETTAVNFSPVLENSLNLSLDQNRPSSSPSLYPRRCGFWNRKSPAERTLMVIAGLLGSVIVLLLCIGKFKPNGGAQGVCLTPGCVEVASSIISAMDPQIDPCDDFYQYACGGWIRRNPLPDGEPMWGTIEKLWDENRLIMRNILEDNTDRQLSRAEKLVKTYYMSCVDPNSTIEKLGVAPIEDVLKSIGGWNSAAGGIDSSEWELQEVIEKAQNVYVRKIFFEWSVSPDEMNSSRHVIALDQGGLTLPSRDYYLNDTEQNKDIEALRAYFRGFGMLMGGTPETARAQANRAVSFQRDLAKIFIPEVDRTDDKALYNKMTIAELQTRSPFLDWLSFFRNGFEQVGITLNHGTEVVIRVPSFFQNLSSLINDTLAKPDGKTILANYVALQTVHSLVYYLPADFRTALRVLQRVIQGTVGIEAPWRICITDTDEKLSFALSSMFIKHAFDRKSKQDAKAMVDQIKSAFKDNLPHLKWMDEATRALAKDKADHVIDMIAFPDFLVDAEKLDERYVGLELKDGAYLENSIKTSQRILKRSMKNLDEVPRREEWELSPIQANAFYNPSKNHIEIPAGFLQAPFYHIEFPRSLNFGAIGSIMGHELTHAFDDKGREYDKEGNLKQWWNNRTIDAFTKQAKCFEDQYSQFLVDNEHMNGKTTLTENIADNGGLKAAFNAYRAWVKKNKELPPLPGINLTHEQLFYIGFAQAWCSIETPEQRHMQLLVDEHSLPRYRVIGSLSNSVEFAKTYGCRASAKMNPQKKCELW